MRIIRTLFFGFCLLIGSQSHGQNALYADAGTGTMRNYISWFDWAGFNVANGASKTFTTSDGLSVTITFSNVSASPLTPYVMNTWSGAVLWKLYDFTNPSIKPALFSNNTLSSVGFQMTVTATRDGVPAPFTLIAADAEASDNSEVMTLSTNGSAWRTIEFYRNSSQTTNPVGGCGSQTVTVSQTYGGAAATGQNPILASDGTGSMTLNTAFNRTMQGNMAVAFGIFSPIDRGDLPASYLHAQHALSFTTSNSCNFNPPYPSITQTNWSYLGTQPGDADGSQTTNDNLNGADEDAVSVFPTYNGSGSYSLVLTVRNTHPAAALSTLRGWFDFNRDGIFLANEAASVLIPGGSTSATLTWSGLPASLPSGSVTDFAFRFRTSFNGMQIQNPGGYASDGEVEDYLVPTNIIQPPQLANASFSAPDTVCVGTSFNITNQSTGATSYLWNFCQLPISTTPTGVNLGNPGSLGLPVYMDYFQENGNWYGLVVNNTPGGLVRLNFGNSLLNTPSSTYLGNFGGAISNASQGIQIVKSGTDILAIIVGGDPVFGTASRVLKLNFGSSITNIPTLTNWGNPGGLLNYPHDIHIFNESGIWYGLTVNFHANTITKLNFGTNFSATPTATDLGNNSISGPTGIFPIVDNGFAYLFVANFNGNSVTRVNFGSSFNNTPSGSVSLGSMGGIVNTPRDLFIYNDCGQKTGYLLNGNANQLVRLDFAALSSVPNATVVGNVAGFSSPHSFTRLFRYGSNLYSFVPNVGSNTLSRITFSGSCNTVTQQSSTNSNPGPISYSAPGTYTISLVVNENTINQSSFCKQIVVMPALPKSPIINYQSCGGVAKIGSSIKPATYLWNTGATTDSILVSTPGTYWVESSRFGCSVRDSFIITFINSPVDFGYQQDLCNPKTINFSTVISDVQSFQWNFGNGQTNSVTLTPTVTYQNFGTYPVTLSVFRNNGCIDEVVKLIPILVIQNNSLITTNDTTICAGGSVRIRQGGTGIANCFRYPTSTTSITGDTTVTPGATSVYYYTVQVPGANLVSNGNFDQGNTGFTSQYTAAATNTTEGQYWVGSSPSAWNSALSNCGDHTAGNGQMLMVNGSPEAGKLVWTQTIVVVPNTTYSFSTWIQSLYPPNPANLRFSINNNIIGNNISASTSTCQWQSFKTTWNSGNSTTAIISIVNNNTIVQGNDFALDDIYFGASELQTDSLVVTVLPKPVVNITNADTAICSGSSVQLNASTTIGSITWSPTTYLNNASLSNPISTPASTIKYYAEATSGAGCVVRDSITITVTRTPQVQTIADTTICDGSSIVLQSAISDATNIQWQPAASLSSSSITSPVATPTAFTEYIVTATNNGMCPVKDSVKVDIKPSPVVTITNDTTVCGPTSVQLLATGGGTYLWSPSTGLSSTTIANPVAQPTSTTEYQVTVTGANGCQKTDSVTIQVNPSPVFNISPLTQSVCAGSPVTITAAGGTAYSWTPAPGITNPSSPSITLTPAASGTYSVSITNAACNVSQTLTASVQVNPLPVVTVSKSGDVSCSSPQSQLIATGGTTYQWSPATALSNPNISNPVASPMTNTTYTVKVGTTAGCFAESTITVNFTGGAGSTLYVPNAFTPNNDGLNDEFKAFFPGVQKFHMKLFNGWGEMIFQTNDINKGWDGFYKGRKQGTDVYVYVLTAEGVCGGEQFRKGTFMLIR